MQLHFERTPNSKLHAITGLISVALLVLWYAPWFFDDTASIYIHDMLDGQVVYNWLSGQYWLVNPYAQKLALNGNVPIYAFPICQPMVLLYGIFSPWIAYVVSDIFVRGIAFWGAFLLARFFKLNVLLCALAGICFAFSLSYTPIFLSVAGFPFAIWLLLNCNPQNVRSLRFYWLALFLIGLNSLLYYSVFFVILAIPILKYGFNVEIRKEIYIGLGLYLVGQIIGSANFIYAATGSGVVWQRSEFKPEEITTGTNLQFLISTVKSYAKKYPFLDVSRPLYIMLFPAMLSIFAHKRNSGGKFFILLFWAIVTLYICNQLPAAERLRQNLGGLFVMFHYEYVYLLSSFIVLCVWLFAVQYSGRTIRFLLALAIAIQLSSIFIASPNWQKTGWLYRHGKGEAPQTFAEYYHFNEFQKIKKIIGAAPVISVGLDPMAAVINGVPSLDGYYPLYPLKYKYEFLKVIATSLPASGRTLYYLNWGSRVYTFHPQDAPQLIDFRAAYALGARFVLSNQPIASNSLIAKYSSPHEQIKFVYEISPN